jgi:rhodanese-related sulfurtransferase
VSSTSTSTPAAPIPSIGRDELIGALQSGRIVLVDVLSPESFAAMHIPGAISLPVADIPTRARDLVPDRNAPIVAYCGGPT